MKHLYLFVIATILSLNTAFGQYVITTNASSITSCDGTAYHSGHAWMEASGGMWSWSWYQDSVQIAGADSMITNLCPGNYFLVSDSMGLAQFYMPFTIGDPCSGLFHSVNTIHSGPGTCSGSIDFYAYGGTSPYTYVWSTGDTTSSISSLCPGSYVITATDFSGCIQTDSVTIQEQFLNGDLWVDNGYYANCSGQAAIYPTGGTPPYSFHWSTGDSTNYISYLCDGTYFVSVVDAANDSITFPFTIQVQDPQPLTVDSRAYDDYYSTCSGQASVNPYGGTQPYSIHWSTGDTAPYAYNLCAGTYAVTVVDAVNDSVTLTIHIGPVVYEPLTAELVTTDDFSMDCTGSAAIIPGGGTPPYSIYWSTDETTDSIENLCWGAYTVYVFDATNGDPVVIDFVILDSLGGKPGTSTLHVTENPLESVSVYPNPFTNVIQIDNREGAIRSVKLVDLNGRVLAEKTQLNSGLSEFNELEALSRGTYLLLLSGEKHSATYKLIK